jgi:3-deoxy-7-phosphoheptulonate synthase
MVFNDLSDSNVLKYELLTSPKKVKEDIPLSQKAWETVIHSRKQLHDIINQKDDRKILIVGPCSIHDIKSAKEYAHKLKNLADEVQDKFLVVMRTYFEKPRSTIGWKGFINDSNLNGKGDIDEGRIKARELLSYIAELGLPTATETLSTRTIQFYDHLISYSCIGARTTEAQTHRELASGLTMPVAFKNGTSGDIKVAVDAVISAGNKHQFDGISPEGNDAIVYTKGNDYAHIMLRGGSNGPNYTKEKVELAQQLLKENDLPNRIMIDCSHANSNKDYTKQSDVLENVINQIKEGNKGIIGIMLESNLFSGRQNIPQNLVGFDKKLEYGISITDACIGWEETENIVRKAYSTLTASSGIE